MASSSDAKNHEIEIKLRVDSLPQIRSRLRSLGFRVAKKKVFEVNLVFDNASGDLRKAHALLRVREAGPKHTLTYKGAPAPGKHKSREELEVTVSDGSRLQEILGRLGYRAAFRYEKYRTEFERPGQKGVITVDETPIGVFLELEGEPEWIDRTAGELGRSETDYLTGSYYSVFSDYCRQNGLPIGDLVFDS